MQVPEYFYFVISVLTAVIAISFLVQAGIALGFFVAFVKMRGKIEALLGRVTHQVLPVIASTKAAIEELTPKVQSISSNLAEISEMLKQETATVKVSVDDVLEKTRAQTARVDEMVSGTLDGLSHASAAIQQGVEVPLRHIHGVLNGMKAAFETFKAKPRTPARTGEEPVVAVVQEVVVAETAN